MVRTRAQVAETVSDNKVVATSKDASKPLSLSEKVATVWFALDAGTHLTIELSYVLLTYLYNGAKHVDHPIAAIWKEYGKADKRWEEYDATVLTLEMITVFLMGPLALACLWGTIKRAPWRHVCQLILCACELYGGVMTFGPEWIARPVANPNLSNKPLHVWVHLFFMNALWVWVPLILLFDSCLILTKAASAAQIDRLAHREPPSTNKSYVFILFTLVLYVILVPAVMIYAKMNGGA